MIPVVGLHDAIRMTDVGRVHVDQRQGVAGQEMY